MTNFYSRRANCIYLQSVNSVTLIYINIVQGDNFPKQYHALNTVFRLFHSNDEFQIFSKKINYNGQNFRAFTRQSFQVLDAAIRKSTIKKQYRKVLNISQKKTYMSLFWNKVAGLQPETSFKKGSCTGAFL